ncbi:MAG: tryptophan-rich sensory protein [Oscillospiraceae bacterium]|nr:tryptophan-rich sensory protein [Oscillospiraceae bacterium]
MKDNTKKLILCIGLPVLGGALIGWLTGTMGNYDDFVKPPLSPPGWLFPVVWTVLYALMGYALWRALIRCSSSREQSSVLTIFSFQLALNYLWPVIFFVIDAYWAAVACLVALVIMIIWTMAEFMKHDNLASKLMIPYLLWCGFALYLNIGVAVLN